MSDLVYEQLMDAFKEVFSDIPLEAKKEIMETIIKKLVSVPLENLAPTNQFSLASNMIKLIIEDKIINPNEILTYLVKHTENYIGLLLIGMVFRKGSNPNIYVNAGGYGNVHLLCFLSLRRNDVIDVYFRNICMLLRSLGSNINYPAFNLKQNDTSNLDINYVEKIANQIKGKDDSNMTVNDFIRAQGKLPDEEEEEYINSIEFDLLIRYSLAKSDPDLFLAIVEKDDEFKDVFLKGKNSRFYILKLFLDISTADALSIANEITDKIIPKLDKILIYSQTLPLYTAVVSSDKDLFKLLISKGSSIKYLSITALIANYKKYKDRENSIYKNNFWMLIDAINIGADIDKYQFEFFTSSAEYKEILELEKAFQTPKWKKLCSIITEKPNQEIKQIAFELNLDYNASKEAICNKLKQISLIDKNQFIESAIKRQEDRMSAELSTVLDFPKGTLPPKARCSLKSSILNNPYAYNDTRMAFYRDPEDDEVWCFTSDTFSNLLYSKINPYTGKKLPDKFLQTIKAQTNILRELGVFNFNNNIKDTLKEYFDRSVINNKKTDFAYNTVVKCLSLYGLSEERLNSLNSFILDETILNQICDIKLTFFDMLTPKHQVILTSRILYSISKSLKNPGDFYRSISRAALGNYESRNDENSSYLSYLD